jgi:hypothetical protein
MVGGATQAESQPYHRMTGMDFVFINVKKPKDALQLAKEPEIRSHVTRYQWKRFARRDKRLPKKTLLGSQGVNGAECQINLEFNSFTREPVSISPQIGGLRVEPFQSYPIPVQPWTPLLVDHCKLPLLF